jgi:hypothetical protein
MSLEELESSVTQLSAEESDAFAQWFDEYRADAWDRKSRPISARGVWTRPDARRMPSLKPGGVRRYKLFSATRPQREDMRQLWST